MPLWRGGLPQTGRHPSLFVAWWRKDVASFQFLLIIRHVAVTPKHLPGTKMKPFKSDQAWVSSNAQDVS